MTYRLYRTPIPEQALTAQDQSTRTDLSRLTQLGGNGQVKQLGTQAGDLSLNLQYRGKYADRLRRELAELLESPTIEQLPFSGTAPVTAYYTASSVDAAPMQPQIETVGDVRSELVKEGTRKSHWVAVTTLPTSDIVNPFGSNDTPLIGIPADAERVQAVNTQTSPSQKDDPTPVQTVTTRLGNVDQYDPTALSFADPVYLYDLSYDAQGDIDPSCWDTYGGSSITDANGIIQWGRVFDPSHDFNGNIVLENNHLRVMIDESAGTITADRWSSGSWSAVSLPAEDWNPIDLDLVHIGQARLTGQLLFEATASTTDASAGDTYAVDITLGRGSDDLLITIPSGDVQGSIPTDLESLLTPIASDRAIDGQPTQISVPREEVRY